MPVLVSSPTMKCGIVLALYPRFSKKDLTDSSQRGKINWYKYSHLLLGSARIDVPASAPAKAATAEFVPKIRLKKHIVNLKNPLCRVVNDTDRRAERIMVLRILDFFLRVRPFRSLNRTLTA